MKDKQKHLKSGRIKWAFWLKFCLLITFCFHLALLLATIGPVTRLKQSNPTSTSLMVLRAGESGALPPPTFLAFRQIPLNLSRCLVYVEDSRFYQHKGFDLQSIAFALRLNRRAGSIVYGGSTISQQLARTLFLTPQRNYLRKYLELCLAVELELVLEKDRILELYLNYAEWGNGVFGIADAASHHFGRPLGRLSPVEGLQLLTILPNPLIFTPQNYQANETLHRRFAALQVFYRLSQAQRPEFISTIREL